MKTIRVIAFAAVLGSRVLLAGGDSPARFETIYKFAGSTDGNTPQGLTVGPAGVLYGATAYGGANGLGMVFALQPPDAAGGSWTETVLYSFTGFENDDGANPVGNPIVGPDGVLYGITTIGGYYNSGTAYELQPPSSPGGAWTETVITIYGGTGPLVISSGNFFGAFYGNDYSYGGIFELVPPAAPGGTWTDYTVYDFTGDGRNPTGVVLGSGGALYGTTAYGGSAGAGTVFELIPSGTLGALWDQVILYTFGSGADGYAPLQPPTLGSDGNLYGSTSGGGTGGSGTIYELTPGAGGIWTKTVLYNFAGSGDGKIPNSPLIMRGGKIYGTTASGTGANNGGGTVFELRKPTAPGGLWTETVLHNFTGQDGPIGSLVLDKNGALYGATASGPGLNGVGSIYTIKP